MRKRSRREVRQMVKWAMKIAKDRVKYETKSMKLFCRYGLLDGFEYYGGRDIDGNLHGEDHITVTDPMGEVHNYYRAGNKDEYISLKHCLELELSMMYNNRKRDE